MPRFTIKYTPRPNQIELNQTQTVLKYDRKWSAGALLHLRASDARRQTTSKSKRIKKHIHTIERRNWNAVANYTNLSTFWCSKINCGSATCLLVQAYDDQYQTKHTFSYCISINAHRFLLVLSSNSDFFFFVWRHCPPFSPQLTSSFSLVSFNLLFGQQKERIWIFVH